MDPRTIGNFDNPYSKMNVKPFYVGKGDSQCKSRSVRHLMHYKEVSKNCSISKKTNPQKYNTIKKLNTLGYSPMFEIVFQSDDEKKCFEVEKELIDFYGKSHQGGLLANISDGGSGGNTIDTVFGLKERLRKISSKRWSGKNNPNFQKPMNESISHKRKVEGRHWNIGRIMSQKTKDKIRESRKRKPLLQVVKIDMQTFEELEILTRQEAQKRHGRGISRSLKHGGACGGFFWRYVGQKMKFNKMRDPNYERPKVSRIRKKAIVYKERINSKNEIRFATLKEASDYTGINKNVISRKCKCNNTEQHIFRREGQEFKFNIKSGHKKGVKMINKGIITKFESITQAANSIGVSVSSVFAAVSGRNKTCKGVKFEYCK